MNKEERNRKSLFFKICISGFIDILLFLSLAFFVNHLVFSSSISDNARHYHDQILHIQDTYKLETGYGNKIYIDDVSEVSGTDTPIYEDSFGSYVVIDSTSISHETKELFSHMLNTDELYQKLLSDYQIASLSLLALVIGSTQLLLFFIIPLSNKHRATIGKMIFRLKNVSYLTKTRLKWYWIWLQCLLIFVFASLLPYVFFGEMALIFSPLLILAFMLFSSDYQSLHQWLTHTQTVDMNTDESEELNSSENN